MSAASARLERAADFQSKMSKPDLVNVKLSDLRAVLDERAALLGACKTARRELECWVKHGSGSALSEVEDAITRAEGKDK